MMKHILAFFITLYQLAISPFLGDHCRFVPSCSEYAKRAIHKYGAYKGCRKALWRILRCNPFSQGGLDHP